MSFKYIFLKLLDGIPYNCPSLYFQKHCNLIRIFILLILAHLIGPLDIGGLPILAKKGEI